MPPPPSWGSRHGLYEASAHGYSIVVRSFMNSSCFMVHTWTAVHPRCIRCVHSSIRVGKSTVRIMLFSDFSQSPKGWGCDESEEMGKT